MDNCECIMPGQTRLERHQEGPMNTNAFVTFFAAALFCSMASAQPQVKGTPRPLPEGDGKQILDNACTTCHPITMITNAGHTREDWQLVMERMVAAGAEVPQNQIATVTDYLAKNFPEGNVPKAVIVPGPNKVSFQE